MIQLHTPDGIKEISEEDALKLGIELPRDIFKELDNVKKDVMGLKNKLIKYDR